MKESIVAGPQTVLIKMVLDAWQSKTSQLDELLSELSDEQLLREVAPGRNRGIYLLGHLTALADSIFPLLGHEKSAPHLFTPFVLTPDKEGIDLPPVGELRKEWTRVNTGLSRTMAEIDPDDWFQKHSSISQADFVKEPHRNKLNVILSRVSHMDYHLGQMQFLKPAKTGCTMKDQHFTTTVVVDQPPAVVYNTILDVRSWWSGLYGETFEGNSEIQGDEFSFLAGGGMHYTKQKLVELVPNEKLVWLVTEANLSFVEKTDEWKGTKLMFEISAEQDKSRIVFTHIGLVSEFQCYESCAPAWTQYIQERLVAAIAQYVTPIEATQV